MYRPPTPIELNILISLLAEPRHGLGIIQEIAERTENEMFLSPGTLYSALKRMDKSGWIQQVEGGIEPADGNAERRTLQDPLTHKATHDHQ